MIAPRAAGAAIIVACRVRDDRRAADGTPACPRISARPSSAASRISCASTSAGRTASWWRAHADDFQISEDGPQKVETFGSFVASRTRPTERRDPNAKADGTIAGPPIRTIAYS